VVRALTSSKASGGVKLGCLGADLSAARARCAGSARDRAGYSLGHSVGEKRRLYIPPHLAYGEEGHGPVPGAPPRDQLVRLCGDVRVPAVLRTQPLLSLPRATHPPRSQRGACFRGGAHADCR
jgi:hypothetical protein